MADVGGVGDRWRSSKRRRWHGDSPTRGETHGPPGSGTPSSLSPRASAGRILGSSWGVRVAGCPQRHTLTPWAGKRAPKRHTITAARPDRLGGGGSGGQRNGSGAAQRGGRIGAAGGWPARAAAATGPAGRQAAAASGDGWAQRREVERIGRRREVAIGHRRGRGRGGAIRVGAGRDRGGRALDWVCEVRELAADGRDDAGSVAAGGGARRQWPPAAAAAGGGGRAAAGRVLVRRVGDGRGRILREHADGGERPGGDPRGQGHRQLRGRAAGRAGLRGHDQAGRHPRQRRRRAGGGRRLDRQGYTTTQALQTGNTSECHTAKAEVVAVLAVPSSGP